MIVQEYFNEMPNIKGNIGYIVLVYKGHTRYLKYGTSERGTKRFNDKDYRKYSKIKPIYIFETDTKNDIYNFEDLNKAILRKSKGFKWIKNDRFSFFQLPNKLPTNIIYGEQRTISI